MAFSHIDPLGDVINNIDLPEDFKMVEQERKDDEIGKLKNRINKGTAIKIKQTFYFETEDELLYHFSQPDSEDRRLWLYILHEMENIVIKQYHDQLGQMALTKTYKSEWGWSTSSKTCTGNSTRILKLEPQGALIAHLSTMSTSVIS